MFGARLLAHKYAKHKDDDKARQAHKERMIAHLKLGSILFAVSQIVEKIYSLDKLGSP